jgi:hypothetical protein
MPTLSRSEQPRMKNTCVTFITGISISEYQKWSRWLRWRVVGPGTASLGDLRAIIALRSTWLHRNFAVLHKNQLFTATSILSFEPGSSPYTLGVLEGSVQHKKRTVLMLEKTA